MTPVRARGHCADPTTPQLRPQMVVHVRLFALLRERACADEIELEPPEDPAFAMP